MASNKTEYTEIARAGISDAKNVVISNCSKGGYTIAQQMVVKDGKSEVGIFMKGAIHIADLEALKRVRDALNVTLDKESNWDE